MTSKLLRSLFNRRFPVVSRTISNSRIFTSSTAKTFDDIVFSRGFTKSFDKDKSIDPELLKKILRLSQQSPSSFNLQPWKVILVQEESVRCAVADSMLGGNGNLVRNAPLTLVYLSDREPAKLAQSLMALESSQGSDSAYVSSIPSKLSFLLGNGGWLSNKVKVLATHLSSPINPSPVVPTDAASWSVKNTMLAAMTFMLAASANGLSTSPMEGFDERRLCSALNIPVSRFTVPLVICAGYQSTHGESINVDQKTHPSVKKGNRRYPLIDICYSEKYNRNWKALENERSRVFSRIDEPPYYSEIDGSSSSVLLRPNM